MTPDAAARIRVLEERIAGMEFNARTTAEARAKAAFPHRAGDISFGVGKSAGTQQLRWAYETRYLPEEMSRRAGLIAKYRRKIERIRAYEARRRRP